MGEERVAVTREEIGLLLSYATRPHRMNEELIHRLVSGVTRTELTEICLWVGLPESTALRLVEASRATSGEAGSALVDVRFHRAIVTLIVVMVVANIGFAAAAGFAGAGLVLVSGAGVAVGYLVYRIIAAIAAAG